MSGPDAALYPKMNGVCFMSRKAKELAPPIVPKQPWYKQLWRDRYLYMMLLPVMALVFIFMYVPMGGILMAFQEYSIGGPILPWDPGVKWVGFEHFIRFFESEFFGRIIWNTVRNSLLTFVLGFWVPIVFALLLNEIGNKYFKKVVQTVSYMPHFISTVVVAGILLGILDYDDGIVNQMVEMLGLDRINFFNEPVYFPFIVVISGVWQSFGWNSILYLAAIAGIDQSLYEAARLDGASRLQQIWHITLPGITPTIVIILVFALGGILGGDMEKILLLYNPGIYETADIIQTYTYREGIYGFQYSYSTAVSLFVSVLNFALVFGANKVSNKLTDYGLW